MRGFSFVRNKLKINRKKSVMGKNGGKRPGAGRPKGMVSKDRQEFVEAMKLEGPLCREKLRELIKGVVVQKETKDGPAVYEKPPDIYAITYALDQAYGKARQHVEVEGNAMGLYERLFMDEEAETKSEEITT